MLRRRAIRKRRLTSGARIPRLGRPSEDRSRRPTPSRRASRSAPRQRRRHRRAGRRRCRGPATGARRRDRVAPMAMYSVSTSSTGRSRCPCARRSRARSLLNPLPDLGGSDGWRRRRTRPTRCQPGRAAPWQGRHRSSRRRTPAHERLGDDVSMTVGHWDRRQRAWARTRCGTSGPRRRRLRDRRSDPSRRRLRPNRICQ